MNKREFQRISLHHKPKNAKSFGEGSYVFSTPAPLYEHGLDNEESRGVGYYKLSNGENVDEFPEHFVFDGNLEKFRADDDFDEYDNNIDNYEQEDDLSISVYADYYDTDIQSKQKDSDYESKVNGYKNEDDNYNENEYDNHNSNAYDYFPSNGIYSTENKQENGKISVMDKFYSFLAHVLEGTNENKHQGKMILHHPESRQQIPLGAKSYKEIEHHHHHFDQKHDHEHLHLQKHGHEHEHVENHTYYNNHNHNHKHDHYHEHVEKHEHAQGHKHLHNHHHEHKGRYSSQSEPLSGKINVIEQLDENVNVTGYNNDVKAYIKEHNIKTYNDLKDYDMEIDDMGKDYMEEVHYLDTE